MQPIMMNISRFDLFLTVNERTIGLNSMTKTQVARSPCQLLSLQKLNSLAALISNTSVRHLRYFFPRQVFWHHLDALSSPKALSAHHGT